MCFIDIMLVGSVQHRRVEGQIAYLYRAPLMLSSPIMSLAEIFPKMVIVKMGMFPRIPQPECESFALHRHDWQGKHGDMTQYEIARGGKKLGD